MEAAEKVFRAPSCLKEEFNSSFFRPHDLVDKVKVVLWR